MLEKVSLKKLKLHSIFWESVITCLLSRSNTKTKTNLNWFFKSITFDPKFLFFSKSLMKELWTLYTRLFWSRDKFENYFLSWAALLKISDNKVVISSKQKKIGSNWSFLRLYWQLLAKFLIVEYLYVAFSHSRKRSMGRKNKSEGRMRPAGRTLAMSVIYYMASKCWF